MLPYVGDGYAPSPTLVVSRRRAGRSARQGRNCSASRAPKKAKNRATVRALAAVVRVRRARTDKAPPTTSAAVSRRVQTLIAGAVALAVLVPILLTVPILFVALVPGQTINTIGSYEDEPSL